MSIWDLRQAIESNTPLWFPLLFGGLLLVVAFWISRKTSQNKESE